MIKLFLYRSDVILRNWVRSVAVPRSKIDKKGWMGGNGVLRLHPGRSLVDSHINVKW